MKKVEIRLVYLFFLVYSISACQNNFYDDTIFIATWNVENLFDTEDDPLKNDNEFLPSSEKHWTEEKLEKKLNNLARVIKYMNQNSGPDILALQEVENMNVVKRLLYKLNYRDYVIVYRDSPDERGIDVALVYDRQKFNIISADTLRITLPNKRNTRYILQVLLNYKKSNDSLFIFVNHWPSRVNGQIQTDTLRVITAKILKQRIDSLMSNNKMYNIIILGDFNDEPENNSIKNILKAKYIDCNSKTENGIFFNLSFNKYKAGEGTFFYKNNWSMLDQIIISSSLIDKSKLDYLCDSFEIIKPPFMVRNRGSIVGIPLPTFSGNKYLGGFSDHLPVAAKFIFIEERK